MILVLEKGFRSEAQWPGNSATHLGACTKLELPLMLVLLTPLELTCLEGITTDNDLKARMLISSASNTFQLALCDWCMAAQPASRGHERQQEQGKNLVHVLKQVSQSRRLRVESLSLTR